MRFGEQLQTPLVETEDYNTEVASQHGQGDDKKGEHLPRSSRWFQERDSPEGFPAIPVRWQSGESQAALARMREGDTAGPSTRRMEKGA